MPEFPGRTVRPYQLVCAVCAVGGHEPDHAPAQIRALLEAVRETPDIPLTLRCNAGDAFAYQAPGPGDDTPEGPEFNIKRDLEILHKLNLFPGCTLPARIIFNRLLDQVHDLSGICRFAGAASDAWPGCPKAAGDSYQRGREKGIAAFIPPRAESELKQEKADSLAAMYAADAVRVRPHILMCSICQYGGGTRPPFAEDNLPELVELMLRKPDVRITLAPYADWMMCAPCPYRVPALNACVNNKGSGGLPNQLRDLRVLQKLGLAFGSTMNARELYRLMLARIPGTLDMCRIDHERPSVWWTGCGAATADSENYANGRKQLMALLG